MYKTPTSTNTQVQYTLNSLSNCTLPVQFGPSSSQIGFIVPIFYGYKVASFTGLCPDFSCLHAVQSNKSWCELTWLIQSTMEYLLLVPTTIRQQSRMEWLCAHWGRGMAGNCSGMDSEQWWPSCDSGQIWRHENKHFNGTPENAGLFTISVQWDTTSECGVKGLQYIQEKPQSGWWFWALYTSTTVIC